MELRCGSKILHGTLDEEAMEVACRSKWCGKRPGITVLHRFSKHTGELIETRRYAEPTKKEVTDQHDDRKQSNPLRSA